ncbi:hypothetical protein VV01_04360 [Luteipulveratus halotolerans]|uniref:HTH araC/xylS-type domain-containing protein n=2 Tax=Luteipulveratus halotolerans TaxID=1631356 RepID=A0A0L6CGB7_9MICO|nr:hypothetical protein VV01_04360 [Luteipulveratus halotolerans]
MAPKGRRTRRGSAVEHHVVVVATEGVHVFELAIPCEVFGIDRGDLTPQWYSFEVVSAADAQTTGGVSLSHGLSVSAGRGLAALNDADTIVVPACASIHEAVPQHLIDALRSAHARGARIVSICSGAFVLAEAGLLDGRRATAHWMYTAELAARYPLITVDPSVLYVHDDVWTSAGSAAALDMCLEIVRADHGSSVANEVARRIVIPPHRNGGQAQYVRHRPLPVGHDLATTLDWARHNLDTVTVTAMATRAGTSTRTLHRTVTGRTGQSPQEWLLRERLSVAQELLESTSLTTEAIARRVGLGSSANLRGHFSRAFGLPPRDYRMSFAKAPPALRLIK